MILFALMIALFFSVLIDTAEIETAIAIEDMERFFDKLHAYLCDDYQRNVRVGAGGIE